MPTITIEGPPLDVDRKRLLVKNVTSAAVEIYSINEIIVLIKENSPENVGIRGELLVDRDKEK